MLQLGGNEGHNRPTALATMMEFSMRLVFIYFSSVFAHFLPLSVSLPHSFSLARIYFILLFIYCAYFLLRLLCAFQLHNGNIKHIYSIKFLMTICFIIRLVFFCCVVLFVYMCVYDLVGLKPTMANQAAA